MTRRQEQPDRAFMQQRLDGGLYETATDRKPRCVTSCVGHIEQLLDGVFDAIHHGDGVGVAALLEHGQVHGALAVHAHHVGLDLLARLWRTPISATRTGACADHLERQLIDLARCVRSWLLV